MRWIEARCAELEPDGSLQIMYGIDGRHELPEEMLPHLEGYRGSRPVRIGNARLHAPAARHLRRADGRGLPLRQVRRADLARPVDATCVGSSTGCARTGGEPDEGIWEVRGGRQEFLYSRVMCWVAIDRAHPAGAASARSRRRSARWYEVRDTIYETSSRASGTRSGRPSSSTPGRPALDASALLMPLVRFIVADRPALALDAARDRARAGERLARLPLPLDDAVLRRPRPARRAPSRCAPSGTSSACRAWATCTRRASSSRRCSATRTTSGSTARSSARRREHLGNFPQAFTHLALISAAYDLDRRLSAAGHAG